MVAERRGMSTWTVDASCLLHIFPQFFTHVDVNDDGGDDNHRMIVSKKRIQQARSQQAAI